MFILIEVDQKTQIERLEARDLSAEQIQTRVSCQYDFQEKKTRISEIIKRDKYGHLWILNNSQNNQKPDLEHLLSEIKGYFGI